MADTENPEADFSASSASSHASYQRELPAIEAVQEVRTLNLDRLSAAEASASVNEGATIAAHARHLSYGLSLINRWTREGGNPFADAKWDEAWKTSRIDDREWEGIRRDLAAEAHAWFVALGEDREVSATELSGMIASIAHLAYHLGAIRQIDKDARGPKEGTFA